ncbi:hypothetical protein Bca4012_064965 [Brassica carinata]|uniref:Uncharacterized protein n=1 Tax=Brassica carinata TaxID=52824 RepID=A0A8X7VNB0_BRACI|nr:hypothetical protein Bca52824_017419 [Brassica carinata]
MVKSCLSNWFLIKKLELKHKQHIAAYVEGNKRRLVRSFEAMFFAQQIHVLIWYVQTSTSSIHSLRGMTLLGSQVRLCGIFRRLDVQI